jgi:hypothetical protein
MVSSHIQESFGIFGILHERYVGRVIDLLGSKLVAKFTRRHFFERCCDWWHDAFFIISLSEN